jgi:integrase-like protein
MANSLAVSELAATALAQSASRGKTRPPMKQAELLGSHVHETVCGTKVAIWQRGDVFLARGRYQRRQFGKTLGSDPAQAASALRRLLVEIENGAFERPSEARKRILKTGPAPRCSFRELCDWFLAEKRRLNGKKTAGNYLSRLAPAIEFAERPTSRRRWPLAADLDREFALQLRTGLFDRTVTRNGHAGSFETKMSARQVYNVLDCLRSLFNWAKRPDVNRLPAMFVNPFSSDIVGAKVLKDPLRPVVFPVERRLEFVAAMDAWQLCQFALSLCLPLRPEDFCGLLISEVDFAQRLLRFGNRFGDRDFGKGKQNFLVPLPEELTALMQACIADRVDGPLLRKRAVCEGEKKLRLTMTNGNSLAALFDKRLMAARAGEVQAAHDAKRLFRRLLSDLGGVTPDLLAKEFKRLIEPFGFAAGTRFYDLRGSVSTDLERAGVSHLVQRYVTGHTTRDIMNHYVSLDVPGEMRKHFERIKPLLAAIETRAASLGIYASAAANSNSQSCG